MGKYEALEDAVFSVFASTAWKATLVKTYPSNYLAVNAGTEFIRVSVIPRSKGLNLCSAAGVIIIDIFTPAGVGPRKASSIADKLDVFLAGNSVQTASGNTQFGGSALAPVGVDKDNAGLYRSTYTIPFNHFGVSQ